MLESEFSVKLRDCFSHDELRAMKKGLGADVKKTKASKKDLLTVTCLLFD